MSEKLNLYFEHGKENNNFKEDIQKSKNKIKQLTHRSLRFQTKIFQIGRFQVK